MNPSQPPATKPDRRIQKTRRALQDALLGLIVERRYDKITVQDILDRADIGRSTFYAHYRDKDDLLLGDFAGAMQRMFVEMHHGQISQDDAGTLSILPFLQHAQEHLSLYRALLGTQGIELIKQGLQETLYAKFQQDMAHCSPPAPPDSASQEVALHYLTGAALACITWWLDADTPCAPEVLDAMLQKLNRGCLEKLAQSPSTNPQRMTTL
ncbi:MAG: TetR/AcrR family transcriptional regulator [Caldilineaceae bacterium]